MKDCLQILLNCDFWDNVRLDDWAVKRDTFGTWTN